LADRLFSLSSSYPAAKRGKQPSQRRLERLAPFLFGKVAALWEGKMVDTPHRLVGNVADGAVTAVKGIIGGGAAAIKGAGKTLMRALDEPFVAITGKEGPHKIVDLLADGAIDTGLNFVENGIIGSVEKAGNTIMRALDHFPEQTGLPPELPKILRGK